MIQFSLEKYFNISVRNASELYIISRNKNNTLKLLNHGRGLSNQGEKDK